MQLGTKVMLRAGTWEMWVCGFGEDNGHVRCKWIDKDGKPQDDIYPREALEVVEEKPPHPKPSYRKPPSPWAS